MVNTQLAVAAIAVTLFSNVYAGKTIQARSPPDSDTRTDLLAKLGLRNNKVHPLPTVTTKKAESPKPSPKHQRSRKDLIARKLNYDDDADLSHIFQDTNELPVFVEIRSNLVFHAIPPASVVNTEKTTVFKTDKTDTPKKPLDKRGLNNPLLPRAPLPTAKPQLPNDPLPGPPPALDRDHFFLESLASLCDSHGVPITAEPPRPTRISQNSGGSRLNGPRRNKRRELEQDLMKRQFGAQPCQNNYWEKYIDPRRV